MKKFLFAVVMMLAAVQTVQASNSLAHIYFAERFFEHFPKYDGSERQEFIVGTLFPDIRDLDPEVHDLTHIEGVTMERILNAESPFLAGWMLHCLVDDVRTAFQKEWDVFNKLSDFEVRRLKTFLKIVEDEAVYGKIHYGFALASLNHFYEGERAIEKNDMIIAKWHFMNQKWLQHSPVEVLAFFAAHDRGYFTYAAEDVADWNGKVEKMLEREDFKVYFDALLNRFEEVFTQ